MHIKLKILTDEESYVIKNKVTERSFTNQYWDKFELGIYTCRQCGLPLFDSEAKYEAGCGWPSFEKTFPSSVKESLDSDGERTEITCARCGGHLGHVFRGEKLTETDTRHCANSLSLNFIPTTESKEYLNDPTNQLHKAEIILGGGCFWCIEAALNIVPGVLEAISGYAGGTLKQGQQTPKYEDVISGKTGFIEVVKVIFDQQTISLSELLDKFFLIHDPTTKDKQGNDIGNQYRSIVFYQTATEVKEIKDYITQKQKEFSLPIVTEIEQLQQFFPAEDYHQRYFEKHPYAGYCQLVVRPKVEKITESLS